MSSHLGTHNKAIADTFPDERLVLLEDTAELVVKAADLLQLQITPKIGMRELVKFSLRVTPNRIIVGEVRGGCSTVHGEDADKALERLSDLAREGAGGIDQRHLVLRAVHRVVVIAGFGRSRRVRQIVKVTGWNPSGFTLQEME